MKTGIVLYVCALTTALQAQSLKTFDSPDGLFRFNYSTVLVDCMPTLAGGTVPASVVSACSSQDGMCYDGEDGGQTIACLGYPKERLRDKPSFVAATFFVAEIRDAKTEKICLKGSEGRRMAGDTSINGVPFVVFVVDGRNWAGGSQTGPLFRSFRHGKCFELGLQTAMDHGYDAEVLSRFTKQDDAEIRRPLKQALDSFIFTK
jgi:hypothetical protein